MYERIKQFMIKHKFGEEDLRKYVKHEVHVEVSSKGMKPTKFESLDDAAAFMEVLTIPLPRANPPKVFL